MSFEMLFFGTMSLIVVVRILLPPGIVRAILRSLRSIGADDHVGKMLREITAAQTGEERRRHYVKGHWRSGKYVRGHYRFSSLDRHYPSAQRRVCHAGLRLTCVAASLMPPAVRARYTEEFFGELRDLADSGAGSVRQVQYGFHLLLQIIPMRSALRSPRRRSAAP